MDEVAAIKAQVTIREVLATYGIVTHGDGPQQLHCPFHGVDRNKSARVYPESESLYCFVCDRTWDVLAFVQDKEELSFAETCRFIRRHWQVELQLPDYEVRLFAARRRALADPYELSEVVERLFIAHVDSLTDGNLTSILTSYNECLAAKDALLAQEPLTSTALLHWQAAAKLTVENAYGQTLNQTAGGLHGHPPDSRGAGPLPRPHPSVD